MPSARINVCSVSWHSTRPVVGASCVSTMSIAVRCVPCLIRRAAFLRWGNGDATDYHYEDLSIRDNQHRNYDDVRSAAFAALSVERSGVDEWAGDALNYIRLGDTAPYTDLTERGMAELTAFLHHVGAI